MCSEKHQILVKWSLFHLYFRYSTITIKVLNQAIYYYVYDSNRKHDDYEDLRYFAGAFKRFMLILKRLLALFERVC